MIWNGDILKEGEGDCQVIKDLSNPPNTTPPSPPAMDQGRVIYEQRCLECYGLQGRDDGVKAPFLSPHPGNLVLAATSEKSDKYLLKVIANGRARTAMSA